MKKIIEILQAIYEELKLQTKILRGEEYPDMFKGVTIGNGKIRIGLPGINKDIVLDANDIETFKQSLVK